MEPRFDAFTGQPLTASTSVPALVGQPPALREGEVYVIDDSEYTGNYAFDDQETFTDAGKLAERLAELANERDMGTGDNSCHNERPVVYIRRSGNVDFTVMHSIRFG